VLCALGNILRVLVGRQDQRCARSGIYYAYLWGVGNILRILVGRQDQHCARSRIYYAYLWGDKTSAVCARIFR
jgi:hypothetical protein